ncbi:MAG: hypothetical protein K9N23_07610 [Akkermansiaceae bacterium]|nr:hypothetical protein [Akkermansiaceae bacterium]MCF7731537.1 hypothetical protein [Akkermansiaceae bacterium]
MNTLNLRLAIPALVLGLFVGTRGQEEADVPRGWLRMLPVGDAPPYIQETRGGVRHEVDAPQGSVPPREVVVPAPGKSAEGEGKVRMTLGRVSEAVLVGVGPVVLSAKPENGEPARWTQIMMPRNSAALAIIFRDPRQKSWDAVRSIVVADDIGSFPAGTVRFVNATPFEAGVSFEGKNTLMKAGQVMLKQPARGAAIKDEPVMVAIRDANGKTARVFDSTISQDAGERTNVVIYWADGANPRRPSKVLLHRERPAPRKMPGAR